MLKLIRTFFFVPALLASAFFAAAGHAESYPTKPVTLINFYPAGGVIDIVGRSAAHDLTEILGQKVVVKNISGGVGTIGMAALARKKPDGYTIGFTTEGNLNLQPHRRNTPYDFDSFDYICQLVEFPVVVFARPDAPFSNLEELAEYAKENRIVYGHPGPASLPHLAMEEFFKKTGITTARSLPFRSAAPGVAALKSGNVDLYAAVSSLINTLGDDGRRQIIAVFDEKRLAKAPNAKTAKEQGFDHSAGITFGFVAPKGIPDTAHQKLSSACEQLSQSPGFVKTLEQQLVRSSYTDGPEFLDFLKSSSDKNRALIKEILAE